MYSLTVRDHVFIAHSLKGEVFGPAQGLHGATYVIDVEFSRQTLDRNNIVIDIGLASEILKKAVATLNYRNLDEIEEFRSRPTTTEFLAEHIHGLMARGSAGFFKGGLKVTLRESPVAWASYEAEVR
jgi:6-pyruvoyltetrahydropterin/6-carboxytetrahydropterin synthase